MEENVKIKPTVEWIAEKYKEMNSWLFGGRLGRCNFGLFTTGKGSEGGTLGKFRLGVSCKAETYSRRMYVPSYTERIYIHSNNFYDLLKPSILLNGNYSATEEAWLNTLIHEMCHYYTYMNGRAPKQGHGHEFRSIASYVAANSNSTITIERLASAEKMKNFELDDFYKEKRERRKNNKINRLQCIIIETESGEHELTLTSNDDLVKKIIEINSNGNRSNKCKKILWASDPDLIKTLYDLGYKSSMRTYRYWTMKAEKWDKVKNFNFAIINEKTPAMANSVQLNENDIKSIVENVLMELINNDTIEIKAGFPLSELSPFEAEGFA